MRDGVAHVTPRPPDRVAWHVGPTGHRVDVFLFFSNRLGCAGSLAVSALVTLVLVLVLWR